MNTDVNSYAALTSFRHRSSSFVLSKVARARSRSSRSATCWDSVWREVARDGSIAATLAMNLGDPRNDAVPARDGAKGAYCNKKS